MSCFIPYSIIAKRHSRRTGFTMIDDELRYRKLKKRTFYPGYQILVFNIYLESDKIKNKRDIRVRFFSA